MLMFKFFYISLILIFFYHNDAYDKHDGLFRKIGKYKIVYPKVITRTNRAINDVNRVNSLKHLIAINRWMIKTDYNDDIVLAPNYVAQWIHTGKSKKSVLFDGNIQALDKCSALHGFVKGIEESSVQLTLCDNEIYGLIIVNGKSFFLQPLDTTDGRHALYETKISNELTTLMESVYKNSTNTHKNNDKLPVVNSVDNDCMAMEIDKYGTRHKTVERHLCNGSNKRLSRGIIRDRNKYWYPNTDRPYRITKSCLEGKKKRTQRALTICDTAEYYNMTSDVADVDYLTMLDTIESPTFAQTEHYDDLMMSDNNEGFTMMKSMDGNLGYFRDLRQLQSLRPGLRNTVRWAKIIIGVDYDVIQFHGSRTQQYVYSIFNIVSSLFKRISQTNVLKIVVMKMILYPELDESAVHSDESQYPLFSVNQWNRNLYKNATEKHDMAVWYTHYRISEEVSTSPGAFMCQPQWSCLLVEDVGWLSAVKIAHGIGHLLGMTHDGDLVNSNNCALEALLKTTIMSTYIPAIMPVPSWSTCSIREFNDAIKKYACLERPPIGYQHTAFMPGTFSLDDQCRIEFGDGWIFCSRISVPDPCKELWCNKAAGKRRSCMTRQTVTLEGTSCGRGKRCINHTCEDATRPSTDQYGKPITTSIPMKPFHITTTPLPITPDAYPNYDQHQSDFYQTQQPYQSGPYQQQNHRPQYQTTRYPPTYTEQSYQSDDSYHQQRPPPYHTTDFPSPHTQQPYQSDLHQTDSHQQGRPYYTTQPYQPGPYQTTRPQYHTTFPPPHVQQPYQPGPYQPTRPQYQTTFPPAHTQQSHQPGRPPYATTKLPPTQQSYQAPYQQGGSYPTEFPSTHLPFQQGPYQSVRPHYPNTRPPPTDGPYQPSGRPQYQTTQLPPMQTPRPYQQQGPYQSQYPTTRPPPTHGPYQQGRPDYQTTQLSPMQTPRPYQQQGPYQSQYPTTRLPPQAPYQQIRPPYQTTQYPIQTSKPFQTPPYKPSTPSYPDNYYPQTPHPSYPPQPTSYPFNQTATIYNQTDYALYHEFYQPHQTGSQPNQEIYQDFNQSQPFYPNQLPSIVTYPPFFNQSMNMTNYLINQTNFNQSTSLSHQWESLNYPNYAQTLPSGVANYPTNNSDSSHIIYQNHSDNQNISHINNHTGITNYSQPLLHGDQQSLENNFPNNLPTGNISSNQPNQLEQMRQHYQIKKYNTRPGVMEYSTSSKIHNPFAYRFDDTNNSTPNKSENNSSIVLSQNNIDV